LVVVEPAFAKQQAKGNVKTFTYKKTKQANLEILVHFPPGWRKSDKRPAIVFFFGSGFRFGSVNQFEKQAAYFARRGMVAARADYRVKDLHDVEPDTCVEDGKSAVRWLRENAGKLGVNPNRIVAAGGSAGGYIAACTACPGLDNKDENRKISSVPNALVLFNPFLPSSRLKDSWTIVPTLHLAKTTSPALVLFGTKDTLLGMAEEYLARSKEVGHKAEKYLADDVGHGFFNESPWREKTLARADEFLAALGYLKGKPTIKIPDATRKKK
jgi:acetyl esterase/lipase